jgi:hypothetical protein
MNTINLTTKSGKSVVLTSNKGSLLATVSAANIRNLSVTNHADGLQSCIGQKIIIAFEGDDLARCQAWVAERRAEINKMVADLNEYQRRHDMIEATR